MLDQPYRKKNMHIEFNAIVQRNVNLKLRHRLMGCFVTLLALLKIMSSRHRTHYSFIKIYKKSNNPNNNYQNVLCISENIVQTLTLYDPGGGALKAPPLRFFALTHLILELHYCALVTFPKK